MSCDIRPAGIAEIENAINRDGGFRTSQITGHTAPDVFGERYTEFSRSLARTPLHFGFSVIWIRDIMIATSHRYVSQQRAPHALESPVHCFPPGPQKASRGEWPRHVTMPSKHPKLEGQSGARIVIMIHKAKDLSPEQKTLIEGLLGRSVSEDEAISIRTIGLGSAPEWLQSSWDSAMRAGVDQLTMDEIDAEIDAARKDRHVRSQPTGQ
jgi:hypothetical protein